ncbi:MAG: hypothetical protein JO050_08830, partial [Acidimicrobiia bacterium]|nr:hypothetical protein [Acidimicrobiia bacterium]
MLRGRAGHEEATGTELRYADQQGGTRPLVIHDSNNAYRLAPPATPRTPPPMRPCLDSGELGIAVVFERASGDRPGLQHRMWQAPAFVVESDRPVPAGV